MASIVRQDFQYSSPSHQAETAVAGMWLFLATEVLFFGGLILCWIYSRHWNQAGFDAGARETKLWIGTLNTAILISSSLIYTAGVAFIRVGNHSAFDSVLLGDTSPGCCLLGPQIWPRMAR